MREITIKKNDAGQRLDKFLHKLLPASSMGFLYKMLRKKNIVLNGARAEGKEKLSEGDVVKLFLSDETFDKFTAEQDKRHAEYESLRNLPMAGLSVIWEDADILALDKPANMLSQKAAPGDLSANEYMLGYLIRKGDLTEEEFSTFRPSVCNRLDRNTTGILLAGKTLSGLQELSGLLKSREARKFYRAVVAGEVRQEAHLEGWLYKDERTNRVQITREKREGAHWIETSYRPVRGGTGCTLIELHLITGRTHQLRAHLASVGHPIVGDPKYGDFRINQRFAQPGYHTGQLLHAYRVELPGRRPIISPEPEIFSWVMDFSLARDRKKC